MAYRKRMNGGGICKAQVMEVYDLSTQAGDENVYMVHTPDMKMITRHLLGHMLQYRKMRYVGAKVTLVPASTLPADPLQLSYEAGEPTIDPRDMVNPILHRYNSGDVDDFLMTKQRIANAVPNGSALVIDEMAQAGGVDLYEGTNTTTNANQKTMTDSFSAYYMALMDSRWKKSSVQRGLSVFCKPYAYNVVSNYQFGGTAKYDNNSTTSNDLIDYQQAVGLGATDVSDVTGISDFGTPDTWSYGGSNTTLQRDLLDPTEQIFTSGKQRLGFRDVMDKIVRFSGAGFAQMKDVMKTVLPYVPMYEIVMPPAYKTEFYFRLYVKHYFQFAGQGSAYGPMAPGLGFMFGDSARGLTGNNTAPVDIVSTLRSYAVDRTDEGSTITAENIGNVAQVAEGITQ